MLASSLSPFLTKIFKFTNELERLDIKYNIAIKLKLYNLYVMLLVVAKIFLRPKYCYRVGFAGFCQEVIFTAGS